MTEGQSDEFSDEIKALGERIKALGGSFVALVEFDEGSETTACLAEGAGPAARITRYAALSAGNVDNLFMAVQRDGKKHGHNSVYLSMLGRLP